MQGCAAIESDSEQQRPRIQLVEFLERRAGSLVELERVLRSDLPREMAVGADGAKRVIAPQRSRILAESLPGTAPIVVGVVSGSNTACARRVCKLRRLRGHHERAARAQHFDQGRNHGSRTALRPTDTAERGMHHHDRVSLQPERNEVGDKRKCRIGPAHKRAQRALRPARRLPARWRNVATLTRFWHVREQNLRLAFFETST